MTFVVVLDDPQAFGGLQGLHGLQENLAASNVLYGLPHISLLILEQLEKLISSMSEKLQQIEGKVDKPAAPSLPVWPIVGDVGSCNRQ